MVQPRFVEADKQSATAQRAVKCPTARAANWASEVQLELAQFLKDPGYSRLLIMGGRIFGVKSVLY